MSIRKTTLVSISLVLLGACARVVERSAPEPDGGALGDARAPVDTAYDTTLAHDAPDHATPSCGTATFHPFAPAGWSDVRFPALAPSGSGFVATFVHREDSSAVLFGVDYPTAAARMRGDLSDLLDAAHEAGIVTDQGGETLRTSLASGADGRLATCAVPSETVDYRVVDGGVAVFDAVGSLLHVARLHAGCADVAFVDGHWVALETDVDESGLRHLAVLDGATLEPTQRIAIDEAFDGNAGDRVVALGDHAIVLVGAVEGPHLFDVDVDAGRVVNDRALALDVSIDIAPELDLVAREDRLSLVYVTRDGTIAWSALDAGLDVVMGPVTLESETLSYPLIDAATMSDGIVVAWSLGEAPESSLGVALVDDATGTVTRIETSLPPEYGLATQTLQVAVSGEVVAVALHVDDPSVPSSAVGIWSARCRMH